jgi:hypothetical protein
MKIRIVQESKIICSNNTGLHNYFGWPSVARIGDGSLMAVCSGFRVAHVCPFGKVIGIRSFDEGQTWSNPEIIIDTPLDDRDAGILPIGEKRVIVTSFNNDVAFQRREARVHQTYCSAYLDAVEKRSDYQKYLGSTLAISDDLGRSFTDPIIVPISSPHGPCLLSDGTVLYVGRLFNDKGKPCQIECHVVGDDGTCVKRSAIENISNDLIACEPYAIQLKSGRILVHIRAYDTSWKYLTLYQSVSDDNGYTFTKPESLLPSDGGAPAHIIEHSSGAVISVYGYRTKPYGIRMMVSYDNGDTWQKDIVLVDNELSSDLGYPASVELSDGSILTIYYAKDPVTNASVIKQLIWKIEE